MIEAEAADGAGVSGRAGLYGAPPDGLAEPPAGAIQFSPLVPGAAALEDCAPNSLAAMTMLAPPGAVERRHALALALRALAPGAPLLALAPKTRGGARLAGELAAFGCDVEESSKRHHRICTGRRPQTLQGVDDALAEGGPRFIEDFAEDFGLWSQPGVFSWNHVDPGSALLADALPQLAGRGADLGCGAGFLARTILAAPKVAELALIDIDRRAIEAARRNIEDPRARFLWADIRAAGPDAAPANLDFIVMNPPFHDDGAEDRSLGKAFIAQAARMLRKGGALWCVANRHLPYEAAMAPLYRTVRPLCETSGYKIFEARK